MPDPRSLHFYLAEKGLEVELVEASQQDLTLVSWYKDKHRHAMVPMLGLDDGTCIGEAMAISRYFEETQPEPPLMGAGVTEKAVVAMWEKRANEEGMLPGSELFRNTHQAFADRGLPGSAEPIPQAEALRAPARLGRFFRKFDEQLASNESVAGPRLTVADAQTLCAVDFAKWSDTGIPPECRNMGRWHEAVSARPSAKA